MAGANVGLGVTGLSTFKRDINDAKETVKAFDEALKLNEKQADTSTLYVQNKIELMKQQIEAQTEVIQRTQEELDQMIREGKSTSSSAYQKTLGKKYAETSKLEDMKQALKDVETNASGASKELDGVDQSVSNIDKNVSWKNVADGIGGVADKLERGAKAAYNFGKKIVSSLKGSTGWADDLQKMSDMYDIPVDKVQRMEKVAGIVEADTESIMRAQQRMAKATTTKGGVESIEEVLGIQLNGQSADDLFWEIGDALVNMGQSFDKDTAAQKIFGASWKELLPLFKLGREEYEKMLTEQSTLTDEQIKKLTDADDTIVKLELELQQLKNEFWSENADKVTTLLQWIIDNKDAVFSGLKVIAGGFGLLKLAELAANMAEVISGFKTLGVLGGGKGAEALGQAAAEKATEKITLATGGVKFTAAVTSAAALLAAPMIDKFLNGDIRTADEIEKDTMQILGGQDVVDIYNKIQSQGLSKPKGQDWRPSYMQGQSYDNYTGPTAIGDEVIHKDRRTIQTFDQYTASMDRMAAVTEQASTSEIQANSEMTAAIGNLEGLPAAVAAAVQAGMASVTIVIGESAVSAIGRRTAQTLGNAVQAALR